MGNKKKRKTSANTTRNQKTPIQKLAKALWTLVLCSFCMLAIAWLYGWGELYPVQFEAGEFVEMNDFEKVEYIDKVNTFQLVVNEIEIDDVKRSTVKCRLLNGGESIDSISVHMRTKDAATVHIGDVITVSGAAEFRTSVLIDTSRYITIGNSYGWKAKLISIDSNG